MFTPSAQMIADMRRHEGFSLKVYADSRGLPTQGIGQHDGVSFGDPDITEAIAWQWLAKRLQQAYSDALSLFGGLADLDVVRKEALVQVAYNMGLKTLSQFVPFIEHVNAREWASAHFHLLTNTKGHLTPYLLQVGARGVETALRISSGSVLSEFAA